MPPSAATRWARERTLHHSDFPPERLAAERECSVAVCLPARECASTVGDIVAALQAVRAAGAIDRVVVVDAGSSDGTAAVAAAAGAEVLQEAELLADRGPVLGKGDAMWRALSAVTEDVVCFLDADTEAFGAHFACGLIGPLVCAGVDPRPLFVKGLYRRPFTAGGVALPEGGGRVNHLMARPALAMFFPELAGVAQPLAGEVAARRELLVRLPFATGYGVETAMLLDVLDEVGLEAMAQCDLGVHRNAHQPLDALAPMAYAVLRVIAERLADRGRLSELDPGPLVERDGGERAVEILRRPPLCTLAGAP